MTEEKCNSNDPTDNSTEKQSEKLNSAIAAIEAGNKVFGAQLLYEIIKVDSSNDTAWLWLSSCFDYVFQKKYCLSKALAINPDNHAALKALAQFEQSPQLTNNEMSFILTEINTHLRENNGGDTALSKDQSIPITLPRPQSAQIPDQLIPSTKGNDEIREISPTKINETIMGIPSTNINDMIMEIPSTNITNKTVNDPLQIKPRPSRNKFLFLTILILFGIISFIYFYFFTNYFKTNISVILAAPTVTYVAPVGNSVQVTYKVWCDTCSVVQFISYYPTSGDINDLVSVSQVNLPWQKTIQGVIGRRAIVEANGVDMAGLIYCSISIDGKEITNAVSHGEADCEVTISKK